MKIWCVLAATLLDPINQNYIDVARTICRRHLDNSSALRAHNSSCFWAYSLVWFRAVSGSFGQWYRAVSGKARKSNFSKECHCPKMPRAVSGSFGQFRARVSGSSRQRFRASDSGPLGWTQVGKILYNNQPRPCATYYVLCLHLARYGQPCERLI